MQNLGTTSQVITNREGGEAWKQRSTAMSTGNSISDILWYNSSTGESQIWFMDHQKLFSRATVLGEDGHPTFIGPPWSIVGVGDFNGDGQAGILWHNSSTGEPQIWFMDRQKVSLRATVLFEDGRPAFVGPPWSIVGVGDFDGDKKGDILWYNSSTGEIQIWFMAGNKLRSRATVLDEGGHPIFIGPPWSIVGVEVFASHPTRPNPPSGLRATDVADRKITVSWIDHSDDEDGFSIRFRGKRTEFEDHTGTKSVGANQVTATLDGLRSGYEYTITVLAFNAAGNSPDSNAVQATTPSRIISVSKEGVGSSSVFVIFGTGFTPNSLVIIRLTAQDFTQVQFEETAGGDGKFVSPHSFPCVSGTEWTITAFEADDFLGTFANAIITNCP